MSAIGENIEYAVRSHVGHSVTRIGEVIAALGERIEATGCYSVAASKALRDGHKLGYESARAEMHAATAVSA
jgi:hypothetical protein